MRVVVVGAGLMGSQIGTEYALGGHRVLFLARRPAEATARIDRAFDLAADAGLAPADRIAAARREVAVTADFPAGGNPVDLVVESVVEDLAVKVEVLRRAAVLAPDAILASNTSSLSITELGERAGAPERTVGTHYWNPPLLMPLVEVIRGERTSAAAVEGVTATLRALGKRPVAVARDVPGFVWNRLQLALLREAVWIVELGVASPETVDEVVRDGLARRWRFTGPFQTAALGGADTFERIAANLFPVLSNAARLDGLWRWLDESPATLEAARTARDRGLVEELRRERRGGASASPADGDAGRGRSHAPDRAAGERSGGDDEGGGDARAGADRGRGAAGAGAEVGGGVRREPVDGGGPFPAAGEATEGAAVTDRDTGKEGSQGTVPVRVLRYGKDEPLPQRRLLRAGPMTAVLENGDLRYVKLGDEEVVRRLYGAVRDRNWGTIEPRFTAYEVEADDQAFAVRFTAEHVAGEVDFAWEGRIAGTSAGVVTCSMDGVARTTFLTNRIGWCVLHPMELAGLPAEVETPDGTVRGRFPERISPHQPFLDMVSIRHPTLGGGEVTIRFEGDLFEMEDQRNWTDASYKTYSTPLRLPYPVEIAAGERIRQTVTLEVRAAGALAPEPATGTELAVRVGAEPVGALPPIGLGVASHGKPLSEAELDRLRHLKPAHLRLVLDLVEDGWEERLRQAAGEATALGSGLELEVLTGDRGEGVDELVDRLRTETVPVARLLVFPRSGMTTTEPVAARARAARDEAGLRMPVGGGSRASFTELNRAAPPLDLLDVVGYAITPQIHAFDNASLVETLAAQGETVRSAKAIAGDRPLAIGPITLRPRFNPNATGPEPVTPPGELPPSVDHRQPSLFAAGWTVGSIRALATVGAAALTYYETTGWRGVLERSDHPLRVAAFPSRPGVTFPLYHVLADVAGFAGGELLPVETSDPLALAALALRAGERLLVLVASFVDEPRAVTLALPALADGRVRILDETTAEQAMTDPTSFRHRIDRELQGRTDRLDLELRPFAVASVEGRIQG